MFECGQELNWKERTLALRVCMFDINYCTQLAEEINRLPVRGFVDMDQDSRLFAFVFSMQLAAE
jgi:hypothetical protein